MPKGLVSSGLEWAGDQGRRVDALEEKESPEAKVEAKERNEKRIEPPPRRMSPSRKMEMKMKTMTKRAGTRKEKKRNSSKKRLKKKSIPRKSSLTPGLQSDG